MVKHLLWLKKINIKLMDVISVNFIILQILDKFNIRRIFILMELYYDELVESHFTIPTQIGILYMLAITYFWELKFYYTMYWLI